LADAFPRLVRYSRFVELEKRALLLMYAFARSPFGLRSSPDQLPNWR
jgi:hypothetical protein